MKINQFNRLLFSLTAAVAVSSLAPAQTVVVGSPSAPLAPLVSGGTAAVPGNLTVTGASTVNGTLTVQPAITSTSNVNNTPTGAGAVNPGIDAVGPTSTTVGTKLGETTGIQTQSTGGGAAIQTNGNTDLSAATGLETNITFSRLTTVEILNAGQVNAGQPVVGSQRYFAAKPNVANPGQFTPISPMFTTEAALTAWIASNSPATLFAAHNDLGTQAPLANTGGNLTVQGQTTTNGITNTGDIQTDSVTATGGANVGGALDVDGATTTDGITNDGNIATTTLEVTGATTTNGITNTNGIQTDSVTATGNANVGGALNVDGATTTDGITNDGNIDTTTLDVTGLTTTNGITNTNGIQTDSVTATGNANVGGALNVDGATTTDGITNDGNIATTTLEVTGATTTNGINNSGLQINGVADGAADDDAATFGQLTTEANTRALADDAIRSEFRSADRNLQSQIDGNTRGIAMVAAMTNTTIQAGMTQAIDFNLAQFEGKTGFAFGYGYRINENLQLNAAGASTTDFKEAVGRIGVSYQW